MKLKEFEELSKRTASSHYNPDHIKRRTAHGIIGISTESGELMDAVKKAMFYGQKLDLENVREEVGDLMWYIMELIRSEDWDLEEIMQENIDKLKKRYPDKFTTEHSKNRKDKNENNHR